MLFRSADGQQAGDLITHLAEAQIHIGNHVEHRTGYCAVLEYDVVLGRPWHDEHQPAFHYASGTMTLFSRHCRENCIQGTEPVCVQSIHDRDVTPVCILQTEMPIPEEAVTMTLPAATVEDAPESSHHVRRPLPVDGPDTLKRPARRTKKSPAPAQEADRKSTRLNSSHSGESRMPSSA